MNGTENNRLLHLKIDPNQRNLIKKKELETTSKDEIPYEDLEFEGEW